MIVVHSITVYFFVLLVAVLLESKSIYSLNFNDNKIDFEGAIIIASSLKNNSYLKILHMKIDNEEEYSDEE